MPQTAPRQFAARQTQCVAPRACNAIAADRSIIQNGKLVGAVTHVLINDPTTGAIYELCEDMIAKDQWGNDILKLLPIKDYPLFLIFGDGNIE